MKKNLSSQDFIIADYYLKIAKLAIRKTATIQTQKNGNHKNNFQEFKGFDFELHRIKREFENKLKKAGVWL